MFDELRQGQMKLRRKVIEDCLLLLVVTNEKSRRLNIKPIKLISFQLTVPYTHSDPGLGLENRIHSVEWI